ncbi:MAG: RNA ligase family protein [Alphaproteobacteria bacterium GM202ARS2]|nr:RNA ligase family protein [Alphaproteobacteria bacterium GM202ARS2]
MSKKNIEPSNVEGACVDFVPFPSTPYLRVLGDGSVRGDKVMTPSQVDAFLRGTVIIEEKIDGANLGISFSAAGDVHLQNRGHRLLLPTTGQWHPLNEWLRWRRDALYADLKEQYILFGEWCYARHSIAYDALPDWFIGFDIYDKKAGRFLSCALRDAFLESLDIVRVPCLGRGQYDCDGLSGLMTQSHFGSSQAEGIYLRRDSNEWLEERAKLVHPDFLSSIDEHWSRKPLSRNRLQSEATPSN